MRTAGMRSQNTEQYSMAITFNGCGSRVVLCTWAHVFAILDPHSLALLTICCSLYFCIQVDVNRKQSCRNKIGGGEQPECDLRTQNNIQWLSLSMAVDLASYCALGLTSSPFSIHTPLRYYVSFPVFRQTGRCMARCRGQVSLASGVTCVGSGGGAEPSKTAL